MADEKKYTAQEAAIAVLKKAEEVLSKSSVMKKEKEKVNEIGTKFEKAESNPDKNQDAKLGEEVEHLCEEHMLANKDAERKEGHKIFQKSECAKCNAMKKSEEFVFKSEKMAEGFSGLHKVEYHKVDFAEPMKKAESMAGDKKAPSNPMKPEVAPNQPQAGESEHPGKRILDQKAPQVNPKEQHEGNNPPSGAAPMAKTGEKGTHKLQYFLGNISGKRSAMKKVIALG